MKKLLKLTGSPGTLFKYDLKMKLSTLFILAALFSMHANDTFGQYTKVTLNLNNVTVARLIDKIESTTDFQFVYMIDDVNLERIVSVKAKKEEIGRILKRIFQDTKTTFNINNQRIYLIPLPNAPNSTGAAIIKSSQQFSVSGNITDKDGQPLPGASILEKGTTNGTQTDFDGNFSINLEDENAILVVSYIGFATKEISVKGQTFLSITLDESAAGLEEVVVIAYGTTKKTSLTASVSSVEGDKIAALPITNVSNGIGGRLSGLIVKQGRGEPGKDEADIFVRGISTTGSTQPLIVVDGIPRRGFNEINPNAIESITVLKDAAAVAPYGVAGANGVILVTTKSGKTGVPTLSYNAYVGFQNPVVLTDYVNSYEYALLRNVAATNEGLPSPFSESDLQKYQDGSDPDAFPANKDIWGYLTNKNALLTSHNLDISGGTEKVKYYAALGYLSQDGMWATTNTERYNANINLKVQATNTTSIGFNMRLTKQQNEYPQVSTGRIFELIGYLNPIYGPFRYSNGMPGAFVTESLLGDGYNRNNYLTLNSQLNVEQQIPFIPGLKAFGTFAYDPSFRMDKNWILPVHKATLDTSQTPYVISDAIWGQDKPSLNQNYSNPTQTTIQTGLNYEKSFGNHNIKALGLLEAKNDKNISLGASRRNFNLSIDEINLGSSNQSDMSTRGTTSEAKQIGLVYRVSYNYASKYFLETSGRYDGHYYFAPEERFGFFPSVSVGWRLSEENFIKDHLPQINNLKIRGSYGEVGALAGSPFQYLSTYNVNGTTYAFGNSAVQGVSERPEANPNITWERAKKTDIGLEVGLWDGLFDFEVDYFYEKRSNMLVDPQLSVPAEYGIGLSQVNAGIMENHGVDFTASSRYRFSDDFEVALSGNFTYAKNKLIEVFETSTTFDNLNRRRTGKSLGTQFGFRSLGYFQENDFDSTGSLNPDIAVQPWGDVEPGDLRYDDTNADGVIDNNDIVVIGEPNAAPQLIYGISPSFRYKGFSLDLLFQGAGKTDWYQHPSSVQPFWDTQLPYQHNLDYWTPDNTNAPNPRVTSSPTSNNTQTSSHWMADAGYLRLKNATLSFEIPTKSDELKSLQIYVSGQNLFTWTSLRNYDPEIGPSDHWFAAAPWVYPSQQTISVGTNITF